MFELNKIHHHDCFEALKKMPSDCIDVAITSPPYWGQRGDKGIGSEEDPREYLHNLTNILLEVMRVLKPEGLLWLNIGDAYNTPINWTQEAYTYSTLGKNGNGLKPTNSAYVKNRGGRRAFLEKEVGWLQYGNLLALPWRIILNLCDSGILYRGEIIWTKRKAMPEGKCRRPHRKHEPIYVLAKSERHSFQVSPPVSSVWDLKADPIIDKGGHTSTFPVSLPFSCIEASDIKEGGVVLDPFIGSGTTAVAAVMKKMDYLGFEINVQNITIAEKRISELHCQPTLF